MATHVVVPPSSPCLLPGQGPGWLRASCCCCHHVRLRSAEAVKDRFRWGTERGNDVGWGRTSGVGTVGSGTMHAIYRNVSIFSPQGCQGPWTRCFLLPSPDGAGTRGERGTASSARCAAGVSGAGRRGGVRPLRGAGRRGGRETVAGVWKLWRGLPGDWPAGRPPARYDPRARGVSGWCGTTGGIGGGPAARGGF